MRKRSSRVLKPNQIYRRYSRLEYSPKIKHTTFLDVAAIDVPLSPRPPTPPPTLRAQFTMHQYRLQGPYANPRIAAEVYSRQPKGDFLECSITAAFLGASKVSKSV